MDVDEVTLLMSWPPEVDRLYRLLIPGSGRGVEEMASIVGMASDELRRQIVPMIH